jgi:transposase-like protein
MKTPAIIVASALHGFYEGNSIYNVRCNLKRTYGYCPSDTAIYYWIKIFTEVVVEVALNLNKYNDSSNKISDIWIADETILKIEGKKLWFWEVICSQTRYLLAYHVSFTRTIRDARNLVQRAAKRAGKLPKVFVTNNLSAYSDGIELAFGSDTKHLPVKRLANIDLYIRGTLKSRTKVMRSMKKKEAVKLVTDGWSIHYNFFKPQKTLGGKTPAQKAGIKFPFENWLDVLNYRSKLNRNIQRL